MSITTVEGFTVHLIIAAVLGGIIGLERQWTRHPAGILTTLIVCIGSFAFTAFSFLVVGEVKDVTRVAAQVVSGIGFLGAGVILREGGNVRGLNTAATVWASAGVGILCCLDNAVYAMLVALAIVFLHLVIHPISEQIDKNRRYDKTEKKNREEALYRISVICSGEDELAVRKDIMQIIKNEPDALLHTLESTNSRSDESNKKIRAFITTKNNNDALIESILTKIGKNGEIISAAWKVEHE